MSRYGRLLCPCCRFRTLRERGAFEARPVCYWKDDGQDDADANIVRENLVSLSEARHNFAELGASDLLWVQEKCALRFPANF